MHFQFEIGLSVFCIKQRLITLSEELCSAPLSVSLDGECLPDAYQVVDTTVVLRFHIAEVVGGKGGFGAQLRSLAKQKGAKPTTNFGACRDLSGRRLRHINDELILKKWKDAKDKGLPFDAEQETSTGVDLWFLSVPSWSEGVKVDQRRKFLKPRLKTTLCLDWVRARKTQNCPPTASKDWGCPRGMYCEFAHGEDELRGAEKDKTVEQNKVNNESLKRKRKEEYLKPLSDVFLDNDIDSIVLQGFNAAKKSRIVKPSTVIPGDEIVAPQTKVEVGREDPGIQLLSGSAVIAYSVDGTILTGNSKFSTVGLTGQVFSVGKNYFEVELLSDGLMQLGWADMEFTGGNSAEGDGVGDDSHSWAVDLFRQKLLHNGEETDVTANTNVWSAGDRVGFYLDISAHETKTLVEMRFSLNGSIIEQSFSFSTESVVQFFPVFSIEEQESVLVPSPSSSK